MKKLTCPDILLAQIKKWFINSWIRLKPSKVVLNYMYNINWEKDWEGDLICLSGKAWTSSLS